MLQVMALSTRAILQKVRGQEELEDTFSIMYTPMDTDEYKELSTDSVSNIAGLIYEILPFVLSMALMNIREPEEETIDLIMKRLGVQKSVLVLRDLVPGLVFQGFWTFIAGFAMWGGLFNGKLGLGPIIVISIFYTLQANLRGIIITRLAPGKLSFLITLSLFFLQIALAPVLIGDDTPNTSLATIGCIISPYLQIVLMYHLGVV